MSEEIKPVSVVVNAASLDGQSSENNVAKLKELADDLQSLLDDCDLWDQEKYEEYFKENKSGSDTVKQLSDWERFWFLVLREMKQADMDIDMLLNDSGALREEYKAELLDLIAECKKQEPPQMITFDMLRHLALLVVFKDRISLDVAVVYRERILKNQINSEGMKNDLQDLSDELKIANCVQNGINNALNLKSQYDAEQLYFTYSDFGFASEEAFKSSSIYKKIQSYQSENGNAISHADYYRAMHIEHKKTDASDDAEARSLYNLSQIIADKCKILRDDSSMKSVELQKSMNTSMSSVEALTKFINKLFEVLNNFARHM